MEDRVEHQKKDLRLYARFQCVETARLETVGLDKVYSAKIVDVGLGGVQLSSDEKLPVDQPLSIRIEQEKEVVLRVPGRVRYCTNETEDGQYVSGFKFAPDSHQDRVSIAEFVHDVFQRQWQILAS